MTQTRRGPLNWSPITGREKRWIGHYIYSRGRCIATGSSLSCSKSHHIGIVYSVYCNDEKHLLTDILSS